MFSTTTDISARGGVRPLAGLPVLVTGARGFIGRHLVRRLLAVGADTHAVVRGPSSVTRRPLRSWPCDLQDPEEIERVIEAVQPAVVFHLASRVTGSRELDTVLPVLEANLQATVNLLTAATRHGRPRVVLAGSMEEEAATPSSPYAASKSAATSYARMFHGLWGLPTVVLRLAMVYGPQQPDVHKLVPYVITSLLAGRPPELSSGTRRIDWVYVDDVVEAFMAAASAPEAAGGVFDIGSGSPLTIRDTAEMIRNLLGATSSLRFGAVADRLLDSTLVARPTAAAEVLGWTPRVELREGLRRTIDWYRRHEVA